MNDILATKCSTIFDSAMTSPLGEVVMDYLMVNCGEEEYTKSILEIRDHLEDGVYQSPRAFMDDVRMKIDEIIRYFGARSDISLSLATILQIIEDGVQPLLQEVHAPDMKELNELIAEIEEIAKEMPNNLKEFRAQLNAKSNPLPSHPWCFDRKDDLDDKTGLDVTEIYQDVMALENDKHLEKIVDIISRYETAYSHVNDVIDIDLNRCHPYTLRFIKKYITEVKEKNE